MIIKNNKRNKRKTFHVDNQLKSAIKRKERLWHKYKKSGNNTVREEYNRCRNKVRYLSRKAIKAHEKTIVESVKVNPKKFWSYVKSKTKTTTSIPDLYADEGKERLVNSDHDKADVLGEFFTSVFIRDDTDDLPHIDEQTINDKRFTNSIEITSDIVKKKLERLKIDKSQGPDGISARVLKEMSEVICEPLAIIFRTSVISAQLPEEWKSANITALFKKGDKKEPSNYRPVSLTCIVCKVLESIVRENMIKHMQVNNLFSDKQFGFIPQRSTVLQLLTVLDKWTETIDTGGYIDVAYCDFMKAFDKVSHRLLIHKLKMYGFGAEYVNWIQAFLSNRKQTVIINNDSSSLKDVTSGIPQGSVLGPLLFVAFINDLPDSLQNNSDVYLYADDTKIFRQIRCVEDCEKLQEDIHCMQKWSEKWKLTFHPQKCKTMTISCKSIDTTFNYNYNLKTGLPYMERTDAEKDIGVTIDSKLEFEDHIIEKVNKANSILGVIRRSFEYLDKDTLVMLFKSLVRPHLEYANQIWAPYKKKHLDIIENVQRRATRLIPGMTDLSYEQRLRVLKLPSLTYRRIRGDMILCYKILTEKCDYDPEKLFKKRNEMTKRNNRGHHLMLFKPRAHLNMRKNSFNYRSIDMWNSLPPSVVSAKTVRSFEGKLDKFWADQDIKFNYKAIVITGLNLNYEDESEEDEELVL